MSCSVMCAAGNIMFCHAGRFRRAVGAVLLPGCGEGFGGGGRFRSCVPPSRQSKGRDGVSLFRAPLRVRACGGAGGRIAAARFARVIARARRRTHLARPFPPGSFSRPQPSLSAEKPKGGPREPPLSTFILHHTAKCQVRTGTKNETIGDFSWNAGGNEGRGDGRAVSFMSRHPAPPPQPVGPFSFGCNCRPATQLARTIRSSPRIIRASSVSASVSLSASRAASSGVAQGSSTTRSA